jgi:predicted transcriptional regulator of viral defense system
MGKYSQIRYWIDDLPKMGKMTFSLDEVRAEFPGKAYPQIKNAIYRLAKAKKIQSVWKGYYAIVRPEYGLSGVVPPTEYIDGLMNHLGQKYYVALLSAADLLGAAHQKPQVFTYISNRVLHQKTKGTVSLIPVYKKHIAGKYTLDMNVWSGKIRVSSPELTALDLLIYPEKSGGLNNVATILSELAENIDFGKVSDDFFEGVSISVIQRLGYLLDDVLSQKQLANTLLEKARDAGLIFRKRPLSTSIISDNVNVFPLNKKWKIIINYEVESDI